MEPRIVVRTHYQVDEPAYLGLLVGETSPVQSEYPERVAERLARSIRLLDISFNIAAASYAVDLGRHVGLLTAQLTWAPLGHLVAIFARCRPSMLKQNLEPTELERLLWLRVFLEGDGAALLFLGSRLRDAGSLPSGDTNWNEIARDLFVWCYEEYLKLSSTTADRVAIRNELDRLRARGYQGKSGAHKVFVHLQTMARAGLAVRADTGNGRRYLAAEAPLDRFLNVCSDVPTMEALLRRESWIEAVSAVYDGAEPASYDDTALASLVGYYYERIMASAIAICPLSTLRDAVQLHVLAQKRLLAAPAITDWLMRAQAKTPKLIRLHVDRAGTVSFVRLDDALLSEWRRESPVPA